MVEVDLEKLGELRSQRSPRRSNTVPVPSATKAPEVTVTETNGEKPTVRPGARRRNSRRPSLMVNFERSLSPAVSEEPIDPARIITNCNCEGSKNLTILPFFSPAEMGLSRVNKDTKFWIIEPMTIIPQTEYTIIDPEYILLDKSIPEDDPRHNSKYIARPLLPQELDIIYKGGRKSELAGYERWKLMNYGSTKRPPKDSLFIARLCEKHITEYPVIVSEALINDLSRGLYPNPLPSGMLVNDAFIEWLAPMTKMQVYGLMYFCASGFRQYFWELGWYFPQSYIVADYIAFTKYLRIPFPRVYPGREATKPAEKENDGGEDDRLLSPVEGIPSERESEMSDAEGHSRAKELSWATQFRDFHLPRLEFWKVQLKLQKFKMETTQFEIAYKKASVRWQNYPLHIANMQIFNIKKQELAVPTLRFARSLGVRPPIRHPSLVDIIKERCGLEDSDKPARLPEGSLGPLTAHNIRTGPFQIGLTDIPAEHLTFDESGTTLMLLSPKGILNMFALQHANLFNIAGIPTLFLECLNTLTLFFHQPPSHSYAQSLALDLRILDAYTKTYTLTPGPLQYEHFPIYAARLKGVVDKMNEWRPVSYKELRIRPYNDVLSYHAFWFSCYLAGFTLLSLALALAQTYAQFKQNAGGPAGPTGTS